MRKLNKDELIAIASSLQSKMESFNDKALKKLKPLNNKIGKLKADVAIKRKVNSLLPSRLVDTARNT